MNCSQYTPNRSPGAVLDYSDRLLGRITDGNGPFQSIKNALPKMSDAAASKLASIVNESNHKSVYKSGESFEIPDLDVRENEAERRVGLGLPLSAKEDQVEKEFDRQQRIFLDHEIYPLAQKQLDQLNQDAKAALTPGQLKDLKTMETGVLNGDLKSVEATLQKYKNNPEDTAPFMKVLVDDLNDKNSGIRADYSVDFAMTSQKDHPAEKTVMFGLSSAKDAKQWHTQESSELCVYSNPASKTWAEHDTPSKTAYGSTRTPDHASMLAEDALKEIGSRAIGRLALAQAEGPIN